MAPTVSITGAPGTAPEGKPVTLSGGATSPNPADSASITLSWTVTKDGNPFAGRAGISGPSVSFTPDDEGTYVATLVAVDDGQATASTAVTISGTNVQPTPTISGYTHTTLVLVAGQPVTFDGGFTDPGTLDTHTVTLDWGDKSPVDSYPLDAGASSDTTEQHAYAAAGLYLITYSVADDDSPAVSVSIAITIESPAQALGFIQRYVGTMQSLQGSGEKNGLSAKLDAAIASAGRQDYNATCGQLGAFLNDLVALTNNGKLSAADSAALSSSVWAVHRALGCTKVKVAWLSLSL